MSFLAEGLYSS